MVETLPASLELALYPLRMGFGFVALAVEVQSFEPAAEERTSANAVEEQMLAIAAVIGDSVLPFETEIA